MVSRWGILSLGKDPNVFLHSFITFLASYTLGPFILHMGLMRGPVKLLDSYLGGLFSCSWLDFSSRRVTWSTDCLTGLCITSFARLPMTGPPGWCRHADLE